MSEAPAEGTPALGGAGELDASFASVMDAFLSPAEGSPAAEGTQEAPVVPGEGGRAPASAETPGAGNQPAPAGNAEGGAGDRSVPPAGGTADGTANPVGSGPVPVGVDYATIQGEFGKLTQALERNTDELHKRAALDEVREELSEYFEAVQRHPRLLVGVQVPSLTGDEGEMVVLRDSADAAEWQEMVKQALSDEIRDRATRRADDDAGSMRTLHASIELFQKNADMVPGTKQFDKDLADRVTKFAKPYEVRVDGKLTGYSIPIQPLVEQERARLVLERAQTPAAAPAPVASAAPQAKAGTPAPPPAPKPQEGPQAGIQSRAGNSSEQETYDDLFGTIGLSGFRF